MIISILQMRKLSIRGLKRLLGCKWEPGSCYFNMNITELFFRPCLQVLEETELGLQGHFPSDPMGQCPCSPGQDN